MSKLCLILRMINLNVSAIWYDNIALVCKQNIFITKARTHYSSEHKRQNFILCSKKAIHEALDQFNIRDV